MREKSNLLKPTMIAAVVAVMGGAFSLRYVPRGVEAATLAVLSMTLFAVVWYVHETHLLRLQHFRPYVLLVRDGEKRYLYRNAGNGAALNVRVTDTTLTLNGVAWQSVHYLGAGAQSHDMVFSGSLTGILDPVSLAVVSDRPIRVAVKLAFSDVEGNSYETWMEYVGKEGEVGNFVVKSRRL
jgi:hypothetical protein